MPQPRIIILHGSIGVGKSWMLENRWKGSKKFPERISEDWKKAMKLFYSGRGSIADLQNAVLTSQARIIMELSQEADKYPLFIMERGPEDSYGIFMPLNKGDYKSKVDKERYIILYELARHMEGWLHKIGKVEDVYIRSPLETSMRRVRERGDKDISEDYLRECREAHERWAERNIDRIRIIDNP